MHKTTSELFVWYLSCAAATVINDQYIPDIVDLNYADSDYPTCWLGRVNDGDLKLAAWRTGHWPAAARAGAGSA